MDGLQAAIASLGLVAIIMLLVLALCHRLGPRASAWVSSDREETVGLSKNHLFHANGYLIHQSGSDILLSSTGSFKRFESIDRDYVKVRELKRPSLMGSSAASSSSTLATNTAPSSIVWTATNITAPSLVSSTAVAMLPAATVHQMVSAEPNIPPQPLRPAPAPTLVGTIEQRRSERALKQRSYDQSSIGSSPFANINNNNTVTTSTTSIPRPVARRQMSSPAAPTTTHIDGRLNINLSQSSATILGVLSGPRSATSTNPFLEGDNGYKPQRQFDFPIDEQTASSTDIWLENEKTMDITIRPTTTVANNPFVPNNADSTTSAAPISLENICTSSERCAFNDNFTDAPTSGLHLNDVVVSSGGGVQRPFRMRSRSAADIDEDAEPPGGQMKMSSTGVLIQPEVENEDYLRNGNSFSSLPIDTAATTTNPFRNATQRLQKTVSETYLEQWQGGVNSAAFVTAAAQQAVRQHYQRSKSQQWQFGKSLLLQRQCSNLSLTSGGGGIINNGYTSSGGGSQSSLASVDAKATITRAMSCDSVSSESSVVMADLEKPRPLHTGQLCVGLQTDRASQTTNGIELIVTVMEAKELRSSAAADGKDGGDDSADGFDTFVRLYLVPDETGASQTKLCRSSRSPSYNETFSFWLDRRRPRRSLWFHLYHSGRKAHSLLGEAELPLMESMARPQTMWLQLSDTRRQRSDWGDLMFSVSYLPTAERLTVVVVKARNLKVPGAAAADGDEGALASVSDNVQNVFVKVYLLKDHRKVSKKKTSVKRSDNSPIYNESMIFSVPLYMMQSVQVRLTVMHVAATNNDVSPPTSAGIHGSPSGATIGNNVGAGAPTPTPIGHVIIGANTGGRGMRHWNQMLATLRKPVAMWHPVRQTTTTAPTPTVNATMAKKAATRINRRTK